MQLRTLLKDIVNPSQACWVGGLSLDSRAVHPGEMFIALPAAQQLIIGYVLQALANGAAVILYDATDSVLSTWLANTAPDRNDNGRDCLFIAVDSLADNLGLLAARYYGEPSQQLSVIGITGTNGKTSCSQFLGQLLTQCGIIGTLGWGTWNHLQLTGYTTPDALATQAMLAEFVAQEMTAVSMEVSSHGIAEGRINNLRFEGTVLTNISRDHLDFHGSMAAYIDTKKRLFARPDTAFVVLNLNEPLCKEFIDVVPSQVAMWGYGIDMSDIMLSDVQNMLPRTNMVLAQNILAKANGLTFDILWQRQQQQVHVPLYGRFNIENILAVVTVLLAMGKTLTEITTQLPALQPVNGRMQRLASPNSALIFVDYAHTPDALEKALISARQHCQHRLWVVFGCGGDRDTGKRAQMGSIAEQYADYIIVTDDNPRSEDPKAIVQAILSGCKEYQATQTSRINVIHERENAIRTAITQSAVGDCVVIAGKGHELYQEYGHKKIPFSDVQVVSSLLEKAVVNQ